MNHLQTIMIIIAVSGRVKRGHQTFVEKHRMCNISRVMCETVPDSRKEQWKNRFAWVIHGNAIQILNRESLMCETVPDSRKEQWKNRFAWVNHGNAIQVRNRESPKYSVLGFSRLPYFYREARRTIMV